MTDRTVLKSAKDFIKKLRGLEKRKARQSDIRREKEKKIQDRFDDLFHISHAKQ